MRASTLIFGVLWILGATGNARAQLQPQPAAPVAAPTRAPASAATPPGTVAIDGIAVRIETDIILESEVRELASFQELVDGTPKPRADVISELTDQWIVRGEAKTALFPDPTTAEVDAAYAKFVKQFASPEDFKAHCAAAGLTEAAVRRMVSQQLYLSRFLDYRFRPSAQVDSQQIDAYYQNEFVPKLKAHNEAVPPLNEISGTIREILIQRSINDNSMKWLDDTRSHLTIDIVPEGKAS